MNEVRARLTAIEDEQAKIREDACKGRLAFDMFTAIDRELSDVRMAYHRQRTALNAIGLTQAEHSAALREQGKTLGALVIEVESHGRTLAEHTTVLEEQGRAMGEHTIMLEEQGKMLCEQGTTLGDHGITLGQQTLMLRELKEQGTMMRDQLREVLERLPTAN